MSSEPNNSPERERLPFEPAQNRKKPPKAPVAAPKAASKPNSGKESSSKSTPAGKGAESGVATQSVAKAASKTPLTKADVAIPEVVSRRMVRRMAFFSGIPTALGIATFGVSYLIVTHEWLKLPNVAVVLVSMGFFGLGVLGLTYGVLSASWDEERLGGRLGWGEFTVNVGRMTAAWRASKGTEE